MLDEPDVLCQIYIDFFFIAAPSHVFYYYYHIYIEATSTPRVNFGLLHIFFLKIWSKILL